MFSSSSLGSLLTVSLMMTSVLIRFNADLFRCHGVELWTLPFSTLDLICLPQKVPQASQHLCPNRLAGLVVKASASGAKDPGFKSCLWGDFSGSSHTSDLKIGTQVATLPGAWHCRVSAGTGRPGISILWLGEVESLICKSVWQHVKLCRSVPEIHWHVAGMLSNQPTNETPALPSCRLVMINAVLAGLSACSFPLTPVWPGQ